MKLDFDAIMRLTDMFEEYLEAHKGMHVTVKRDPDLFFIDAKPENQTKTVKVSRERKPV